MTKHARPPEQIECLCCGLEHCPYLWDIIEQMRKVGTQHQKFITLTDELYAKCTREQKLTVYFQHRPAAVVPFVLELLERTHPIEDKNDADHE